jgi:F420-dependent oxidoreductase-like protein
MADIKFGVLVPQGWRLDLIDIKDPVEKYESMTKVAQEADRLGLDSIWLYDHFHTVPVPTLEGDFECWAATAALARDTKNVRIGQMVTCNGYRNPALLAKMASTVDVMSHGRLDFGIGAGWYEHEFKAYGYDFPDGPTRLKMLREALQIIHAMWKDDYATFEGKYYSVNGAINEPKGVQKPHIPIWIGGGGEKVTLKLVAQYGDACNFGGTDLEVYKRKLGILKEHCETVGRDYNSIIKSSVISAMLLSPGQTVDDALGKISAKLGKALGRDLRPDEVARAGGNLIGSPQEMIDMCGKLADIGIDYMLFYLYDIVHLEQLQRFAEEVIPAFRRQQAQVR